MPDSLTVLNSAARFPVLVKSLVVWDIKFLLAFIIVLYFVLWNALLLRSCQTHIIQVECLD